MKLLLIAALFPTIVCANSQYAPEIGEMCISAIIESKAEKEGYCKRGENFVLYQQACLTLKVSETYGNNRFINGTYSIKGYVTGYAVPIDQNTARYYPDSGIVKIPELKMIRKMSGGAWAYTDVLKATIEFRADGTFSANFRD